LKAATPSGKPGVQHASLEEVREFVRRGQSVVFIQFFGRRGSRAQQIVNRVLNLGAEVRAPAPPFALLWSSVVRLAFYIVPASAHHAGLLLERASGLAGKGWDKLFSDPIHAPDVRGRGLPAR
jgi:hypothetical protein